MGQILFDVKTQRSTDGPLRQPGDEGTLGGAQVRAAASDQLFELVEGQCAEAHNSRTRADGGKKLACVLRKQKDAGVSWRLLEYFQQGIGSLLHKGGAGEDVEGAFGLGWNAINFADDGAYLSQFNEKLRWIGRDDQNIRVRLNEDAGLFFVCFAQFFARGDGLFHASFQRHGFGNAGAVTALTAEVGKTTGLLWIQAVCGLGQHESQSVFA